MKVFRGFEEVRGIINPVVTTGSFDGVHIGHKTILNRLNLLARKYEGESVLITFYPHPRKVLYPDTAGKDLKLINSQEEKQKLLEKTGLDNLIIVTFTREFSMIRSEQFVNEYLHGILNAKVVVAGFNHHFGFNQEGDYKKLWEWRHKYGFEAEEIPEQEVQNETVSSTKIRKAISEGYIQRANAYLDDYYLITGIPQEAQAGHLPGFFHLPVTEDSKLLPSPGIYAVSAVTENTTSKGMTIITDEGSVLVQIFENPDEFINKSTDLLFHKKIHGSVSLNDERSGKKIESAVKEINELIY